MQKKKFQNTPQLQKEEQYLQEALRKIGNFGFMKRAYDILRKNSNQPNIGMPMKYRSRVAQVLDENNMKAAECKKDILAAIFLLSTDDFLWSRWNRSLKSGIDFHSINKKGMPRQSYPILKAARESLVGFPVSEPNDFLFESDINDRTFINILRASIIHMQGYKTLFS